MNAVQPGTVLAVCSGRARTVPVGSRRMRTALVKEPLAGPVAVGVNGITGDEHVYQGHGGPDMALLVYSVDHYHHWRALGLDLPAHAAFGENLSVTGLTETDVHLGDVFQVGTVQVQVCQPRSPCHKLAAYYGRTRLAVEVQDTGFTGYLLRVLEPGTLAAGEVMSLVRRDGHGITVAEAGRIVNVDREDIAGAQRVLNVEGLGRSLRRVLEQRVAEAQSGRREVGLDARRLFSPDSLPGH